MKNAETQKGIENPDLGTKSQVCRHTGQINLKVPKR